MATVTKPLVDLLHRSDSSVCSVGSLDETTSARLYRRLLRSHVSALRAGFLPLFHKHLSMQLLLTEVTGSRLVDRLLARTSVDEVAFILQAAKEANGCGGADTAKGL